MIINREHLKKALSLAVKIAPGKTNFPILSAVYIDGPGQMVRATDLEISMEYPMEITEFNNAVKTIERLEDADWGSANDGVTEVETVVQKSDVFCLPAAMAKKIVDSLDGETLEISRSTHTDGLLGTPMVKIGKHFQDVYTYPGEDFPIIANMEDSEESWKTTISRKGLKQVMPAATSDGGGFQLSNIHFDHDSGTAVATDGHRLHSVKADVNGKTWDLPMAAALLISSVKSDDDNVEFDVITDRMTAYTKVGNATVIMRLADIKFPNWKAVIGTPEHSVVVKKSDITNILKQAMILTNKSYGGAKLSFNGQIDLSVINPETGSYLRKGAIPCVGEVKDPVEIGMKLAYIKDVIATAEKDDTDITIGVTDDGSPVYFSHGDFYGLVMPMRL